MPATPSPEPSPGPAARAALRLPAELVHADELARLAAADTGGRPDGWRLSPRAVRSFVVGDPALEVSRKFYGDDALVERCIVTLMSNRGLLLVGEPGTAKSMLSELLAAAVSGDSTCTIQGTSGTTDDQITYSWNYALLLAEGPTPRALVRGPIHRALGDGLVCRFEEVTRVQPEIQDALIGVMSDKMLHVPELRGGSDHDALVLATPGFNVLATANLRDRGVHEMSSALKRRFNFETVRPVSDRRLEATLIKEQTAELLATSGVGRRAAGRRGRAAGRHLRRPAHRRQRGGHRDRAAQRRAVDRRGGRGRARGRARRPLLRRRPGHRGPRRAAADRHGPQGQPGGRRQAAPLLRRRGQEACQARQPVAPAAPGAAGAGPLTAAHPLDELLTTDGVRDLAGRMVSDDLVVLPVRHHSPACAWHVGEQVRLRRPSVVLVEGPRSFDALVPLLVHPEAQMPLAVYTWYVRKPPGARAADPVERGGAFYPFCDYSPELVALRTAAELGVDARFVDLELAELGVVTARPPDSTRAREAPGSTDGVQSLLDERVFWRSRTLRALAQRLGCRDDEDLWERLFEAGPSSFEDHLAAMTAYCLLARRDESEASLAAEGTLAREAEMAWHVRGALRNRDPDDGPVLVVVGGLHAVALPDLVRARKAPARPRVRTPRTTTESALVRSTFDQLERLNGYAAGMTSPGWHQRWWTHLQAGSDRPRVDATREAVQAVARELRRRHRVHVPTPDVVAAVGQAIRLAELRERPAPLRSDLLDALTSCLVKGEADADGVRVQHATRRVLTGDTVGVLPPGAGLPPLIADTRARLKRARLKPDATDPQVTRLDLYRRPAHRATSRLLHGLRYLDVPFGRLDRGPDFVRGRHVELMQEQWTCRWTPDTEAGLVEASLLGGTVDDAVRERFARDVARLVGPDAPHDAEAAAGLLALACVLGLHDQADRATRAVQAGLAADESFPRVAGATAQLGLVWEAREPLEAHRLGDLAAVLQDAFARALYLGRDPEGSASDPAQTVEALVGLRDLLAAEAGAGLDAGLFWQVVSDHVIHPTSALLRGAATGLLWSSGRLDDHALAVAAGGHLGGAVPPTEAVGFVSGLVTTAREAAWQSPALVTALDDTVRAWDDDTFVEHLPHLRLAFASMTPRETDRLAGHVAVLHGLTPGAGLELTATLPTAADDDVRRLTGASALVADLLRADGLAAWLPPEAGRG